MFAVYEQNGHPDYMALASSDSCCDAVRSCFPGATCHHTFPNWHSAKEAMNTITARTQLIEPFLRLALRGQTVGTDEAVRLAAQFQINHVEAQTLFGHNATHAERLAMFNTLLQGQRCPVQRVSQLTHVYPYQTELSLLGGAL